MQNRTRITARLRRHPPSQMLSDYIDGELSADKRQQLEAHLQRCERCRHTLVTLRRTVSTLGQLKTETPPGVRESVLAALRAEPTTASSRTARLRVINASNSSSPNTGARGLLRTAITYCARRSQLRATIPTALIAGIALTIINQGNMLLHGHLDIGMCLMCASDFVVPFLAMNLAVLLLLWRPRSRKR